MEHHTTLSLHETANHLGTTTRHILTLIDTGQLTCTRTGDPSQPAGRIRITTTSINTYASTRPADPS